MKKIFQQSLQSINKRIEDAKKISQKSEKDIVLIAVSKTFPREDILQFHDLGLRHFGENYIQEWIAKSDGLPEDIIWHIIGNVQSNKSRFVAEKAHWLHTLDKISLAERLNRQRPEHLPPLNVCLEVNIGKEPQKHGVLPEEIDALSDAVAFLPRLCLRGLMCVPKIGNQKSTLAQMEHMQTLFYQLQSQHQSVDTLSMGMSTDMELAIACGATHIRIGSALFGNRK